VLNQKPAYANSKAIKMLDIFDFIVEKGGDPKKIKESQRRRYEPEEAVDEVIALYEEARKGMGDCTSPAMSIALL
jgi:hypothetical protein